MQCSASANARSMPVATNSIPSRSIFQVCSPESTVCSRRSTKGMNHSATTVLVVDDDAMNRDALSRCLLRTGYSVLTAENGPEALELVSTNRVDAVLLDVVMPGMSGLDTLRHLRESRC